MEALLVGPRASERLCHECPARTGSPGEGEVLGMAEARLSCPSLGFCCDGVSPVSKGKRVGPGGGWPGSWSSGIRRQSQDLAERRTVLGAHCHQYEQLLGEALGMGTIPGDV